MIRGRINHKRLLSTYQRTIFPSKNLFRRCNQQIFMAKYLDEELSTSEMELIRKYRGLTENAIKYANEAKFVEIAFLFLNDLQALPRNSVLSCDFNGLYYSPSSHVYEAYKSIFSKAFQKSLCAAGHPLSTPLNHSGYYIIGPRGTGKSVLLRLCALVTGQLLPNYIAFYADSIQLGSQSTRSLVIHALNEHLPTSSQMHEETTMNIALATADSNNIAIGMHLDEAQELYNTAGDWSDLHACVTTYNTAVILSGSDAFLAPRVKLTLVDREYLRSIGNEKGHPSLNTTKLSQLSLSGFRNISQYIDYFIIRPHHVINLLPTWYRQYRGTVDSSHTGKVEHILYKLYYQPEVLDIHLQGLRDDLLLEITRFHGLCGGRIRTIEAWQALKSPLDLIDFNPAEIDNATMDKLRPFFTQIAHQGEFDPFNLPVLPIVPGDGGPAAGGFQGDVNEYVRRKLITYAGPDSVTLYSPAVYIFLREHVPTLFISHSETGSPADKIALMALVAYFKEVAITVCSSDPESRAYMSQYVDNISAWEQSQVTSPNRKIIVVLTKEYCAKVDSDEDTGCKREWGLVQKKLSTNPSDPSIVLAYVSPFKANVTGSVKNAVGDRSLLRITDHKSLLLRVSGR